MNNLRTVKGMWTKKYALVMLKDKQGEYIISATSALDKDPVVKVNTKDYLCASMLYDNILQTLNTI